jgi:hypothetical protein
LTLLKYLRYRFGILDSGVWLVGAPNNQGDTAMRTTTMVAQMLLRTLGLILIVLGLLFWAGSALTLVNLHMLIGILFVLTLWLLSGLAAAARLPIGLVITGIILGLVVAGFGMTQRTMMIGSAHWVIRVVHLLLGLGAMGLGERMAKGIRASFTPAQA